MAENRRKAAILRQTIEFERARDGNPLARNLHGASLLTTVDGQVTGHEILPEGPDPRILPLPPLRGATRVSPPPPARGPRFDDDEPSDEEPPWYSVTNLQQLPPAANPNRSQQYLRILPGCPDPRIQLRLKTRVARVRCNTKSFAPKAFSGYIGAAKKPCHESHRLATANGVVWCWSCGQTAVVKPSGLTRPCGPPSDYGIKLLRRLRRGLPPWNLRGKWPDGDDTGYRQLRVTAPSGNRWGTSTRPPPPPAPGSARR